MGSTTTNSQYGFRGARFAFASLVALCALCVALFAIPQDAQAKSYTCPSVVIDATVQPDGSLSVVETRTFDFDGTFSAVWWNFDSMPSDECELSVASVEVASREGESADASSTESASLPEVAFERAWREEGGPSEPSYSLDEDYRTVYVFNDVSDESVDVTLCYSITNFVQVYDDVAELYWQYRARVEREKQPCRGDRALARTRGGVGSGGKRRARMGSRSARWDANGG